MDPAAEFAANLHGLVNRKAYLDAASQLLLRLIPSDHAAWGSLDVESGTAEVVPYPYESRADVSKMMLEMYGEHPVIGSLRTGNTGSDLQPLRLSDYISDLELYETRTFQEGLSLLGVNRQLLLFTVGSRSDFFHCWSLNRWNDDFNDTEVALVQQVQPILQLLDVAYAGTPQQAVHSANADAYSLTAREREVMRLLGQGLKVTSIGRLLGCSPRTVSKHIEHAYSKLGSNNRVDALRRLRGE
ncbi:helix-turn-helix transcriptional regulator [Arthrobacter sp. NPDC057388]|jgi:DNA-binding CsgD family transcriptional regulator|uniref:helix-turn-helix domain-containing protein n=1 Tax=Arthrobacter sp. NPDC057388 TaxID=3346116 RepID=UPI00363F86A9